MGSSRRSSLDRGSVTAGLINESYDEVLRLVKNLDELLLLAANLTTLSSFGVTPTADGGDGTINGDMDAMDWTGHSHANDKIVTAISVNDTENLLVSHKGIIYYYDGPRPALLGLGGSATLAADYQVLASGDHAALSSRDLDDQHTINAITGLQNALNSKVSTNQVNSIRDSFLDRTIHFSESENINTLIGNAATRQNKFIGFDSNGDILLSSGNSAADANAVSITDVASFYVGNNVESALAELASLLSSGIITAAPGQTINSPVLNTPDVNSPNINNATFGGIQQGFIGDTQGTHVGPVIGTADKAKAWAVPKNITIHGALHGSTASSDGNYVILTSIPENSVSVSKLQNSSGTLTTISGALTLIPKGIWYARALSGSNVHFQKLFGTNWVRMNLFTDSNDCIILISNGTDVRKEESKPIELVKVFE